VAWREQVMGAILDAVTEARKGISFDRLLVVGFFLLLGLMAVLSVAVAWRFPDGEFKTVQAVLKFFESCGLMLVGALVSTLTQGRKDKKDE
jgi:hypothetical protein